MTTGAIAIIVAVIGLAVQQWRGQQATEKAIGELRERIARLEGLFGECQWGRGAGGNAPGGARRLPAEA